jgi:predicted esterase
MKRTFIRISCLFLAIGLFTTVKAQQVFKTTKESVIGYLEYLPKDYNSNSNRYPVVIFLHGRGEKGPNSTNPETLEKGAPLLTKLGPPYHVKKGTQFPFILISPQLKTGYGDWPGWYIREVVEHVKRTLRVDDKRIYLTGLSLGGGGVWTAAEDNPDLFAAIAPVCGSRNSPKKAEQIAKSHLPVWAFHGDKDNVVPLSRSVNMINAINEHRPDPRAKMSIYRGVRHDAWYRAYMPDHSAHSPNVYEWMLSHRRKSSSGENQNSNKAPVVSAGSDISVKATEKKVSIYAKAGDPDGKVKKIQWKQQSGGGLRIEGAQSDRLTISSFREGTYEFRVTVTDDDGQTAYDEVKVVVTKSSENKSPEVWAGNDYSINADQKSLTIEGRASDPDGSIRKYQWNQRSGSRLRMEGAQSNRLVISDYREGAYSFRLTVTDDKGATKYDEVNVIVKAASKNETMRAYAGPDRKMRLPVREYKMSGGADSPDRITAYQWRQVGGGTVTLHRANTRVVTVTNITSPGERVFELRAWDSKGRSAVDHIRVNFQPSLTSGSSEEAMIVADPSVESTTAASVEPSVDGDWTNKFVTVFNDRGEQVFRGKWNEDSRSQVFRSKGFYIYHLTGEDAKTKTGKIFIR